MDRAELNKAKKLLYLSPSEVLREFRALDVELSSLDSEEKQKLLRSNAYKKLRETKQAALFCHGLSCRIGQEVKFCTVEASDYDFIATWVVGKNLHIAPVQLKELVPESLNAKSNVQQLVNKLEKYISSENLTVAIYINRTTIFKPSELSIPPLNIAAIWFFSCNSSDQSSWRLIGNFTETPEISDFAYPT